MTEIQFTSEFIIIVAGAVISALFTYVPFKIQGEPFNAWFAKKTNEEKQFWMLIIMFLVTAIMFVLGCTNLVPIQGFVCDNRTAVHFIYLFLLAIVGNQSTDRLLPKPASVRTARVINQ